jgi:hypothetical protein
VLSAFPAQLKNFGLGNGLSCSGTGGSYDKVSQAAAFDLRRTLENFVHVGSKAGFEARMALCC